MMQPAQMKKSVLRALVLSASNTIAPVWPMKTIIAVNPLQGLEEIDFEQAISLSKDLFETKSLLDKNRLKQFMDDGSINQLVYEKVSKQWKLTPKTSTSKYKINPGILEASFTPEVNNQLIKWLAVFLDEGQANLVMPNRSKGFYSAVKALIKDDAMIHRKDSVTKQWLAGLGDDPLDVLMQVLSLRGIEEQYWEDYLRHSFLALNGWSGFIKWRSLNNDYTPQQEAPITLLEYVTIRLVIEHAIAGDEKAEMKQVSSELSSDDIEGLKYLEALEESYRLPLLKQLTQHLKDHQQPDASKRPIAQLVFCIDVRSEGFRRAIEHQGHYETYGFAGFFALPIRVHAYQAKHSCDACPVLLKPRHDIYEQPLPSVSKDRIARFANGQQTLQTIKHLYRDLKFNVLTPFPLAETVGPLNGLMMIARGFMPNQFERVKNLFLERIKPHVPTYPALLTVKDEHHLEGISFKDQVLYGETFLRMIGLTANFAPFVALCGHGSQTVNNPYASALDCGACGGNHGGANAAVMAQILNHKDVREELLNRGIVIPADTVFLGAEHNTTTDEVSILNGKEKADSQLLEQFEKALLAAKSYHNKQRALALAISENKNVIQEVERRADDWSQVRPEWGLAKNAAFIIAPRRMTQSIDLKSRSFLHSYHWDQDPTGKVLETILTAPMVVAQWINNQYLFSTLDPVTFGGGNKITQNVVGKIGVMQGNGSDLMHGLSVQSTYQDDAVNYHEPLRLTTIVVAPKEKVMSLVNKHDVLQKLFYRGWVNLRIIEPNGEGVFALTRQGSLEKVNI